MAQCKQTGHEFIQNAFSPTVAVLCSEEAEAVCMKNNLSFVELIQPFSRLTTEAHIRDAGNIAHPIHNLRVIMKDFNTALPLPTMARKLTNEAVAATQAPVENISRGNFVSIGDYDLQLGPTTPWFEVYRETYLQVGTPSDHEFLKHYLGCIFVVSSSHADPLDQFARLTLQHQQLSPSKVPKSFSPNILKYYVLVHDVAEGEESKAEAVYQSMKTTYASNCHMLQINSRHLADELTTETKENLPDPWSQFLTRRVSSTMSSDMLDIDAEMASDNASFPSKLSEGTRPENMPRTDSMVELSLNTNVDGASEAVEEGGQMSVMIDHPLAFNEDASEETNHVVNNTHVLNNTSHAKSVPKPTNNRNGGHGQYLTVSDHDRLRIFVHEFVVRGLIPWCERTIRNLTEIIQSKKTVGRSFFSATKKWFGASNKPAEKTFLQATNTIYPTDSPEMQMRRLADLAFMFQMYEIAYQTYHTVKRDFNNEHAWMYLAGALEMACLSVFMQGANTQRQCPHHYMESAISTYLQTCKSPQFAARAVLMSSEALKSRGMYAEAAMQFIKLTSEESDLRSALLLEQAGHCFINMKTPMVRKYAFHMILAGHRFSKAGQRKHALRAYSQALQVYKGKNWTLAEDHINFTLGRQSFNLKQLENATSALRHVLNRQSQQTIVQQNAFLREYLFVFKLLDEDEKKVYSFIPSSTLPQQLTLTASEDTMLNGILPQLPLPTIDGSSTKVLLCNSSKTSKDNITPATSTSFSDDESLNGEWEDLEELAMQHRHGASLPLSYEPTIHCYTSRTANTSNPRAVIGEPVTVQVALVNPLKIPLVLTEVHLLWTYCSEGTVDIPGHSVTNEVDTIKNSIAEELVHTEVIEEIILTGSERKLVHVSLTPRHTGDLHIIGIAYNLGTSSQNQPFPSSTTAADIMKKPSFISTIYVRGKQNLEVQGPRLNGNKTEKSGKFYGPDRRLDLVVVPTMPLLEVNFYDFPQALLCGEVQQVTMEVINQGAHPLTHLKVASSKPQLFTFGALRKPTDNSVLYMTIPESGTNEFAVPHHTVTCVCEVPIPSGRLEPGQSASVPMWVRGETTPGVHDINFLFYYESADSNPGLSHRTLRHRCTIITTNSLELKATAFRVSGQGFQSMCKKDVNNLVVTLEIQSLDQLHNASLTEFSILQVSCASQQWSLEHLSTTRETDIKVNNGESMMLCLKGCKCKHNLKEWDKQVVFSNVSYDQHMIDSRATPCADFYFRSLSNSSPGVSALPRNLSEQSLRFPSKVDDNSNFEQALDVGLTVIVIWKGYVVDESGLSQVIMGQHHLVVDRLERTAQSNNRHRRSIESGPLKIIKDPVDNTKSKEGKKEILEKLLNVNVRCNQLISHDFSKHRICYVPIHLVIHNCSQSRLHVAVQAVSHGDDNDENKLKEPVKFTWCGQVSRKLDVGPKESKTVEFHASFCKPGVYNLGTFHVSAGAIIDEYDDRTVDLVPQKNVSTSLITITAV